VNVIRDNVARVRERVVGALERSGRSGEHVTIVGVTKTFGPEIVDELVRAGIADIAENRLQEFLAKRDRVGEACRWHLVGHLQRNKATKAIGQFHRVHSIDSVRIAEALDRLGRERGVVTKGYVQVNTSRESTKHGFTVAEAVEAAAAIDELANVELDGLMTIGPVSMDEDDTRGCFRTLYRLREQIDRVLQRHLPELSMGMSGDFETAIEEGATVLRLGRVLTGERHR
jgi:pyridoxal phosphate enzyme (YggS family)